MYWDTMDILGYDVMAIAYQIYNIYICIYIYMYGTDFS